MTSRSSTREAARQKLADLERELATIDDAAVDARREARVEEWVRLLNRRDELPEAIEQARVELLPLDLGAAWQPAEKAFEVEQQARAALDEARSKLGALSKWPSHKEPASVFADHRHAAELARADVRHTEGRHREAQEATRLALARVDEIEAAMEARGMEIPVGEGLRVARRPLKRAVAVETVGIPRVYLAGEVPPRAVAHGFGPHLFEETPARALHSTESTSFRVGRDGVPEYKTERRTW